MTIRAFDGQQPVIAASAYIDDSAVVIGDICVADESSLWPQVVARADVQSIRIGARTNIQDGSVLHVTSDNPFTPGGYGLSIGDEVTVGHGAILHACNIADRVLIGMGATVLDGAVIETGVMLAAGSLVAPGKVLTSGYLYLGSPARQARPLNEKETAYLSFSAQHYVELKNRYQREAAEGC